MDESAAAGQRHLPPDETSIGDVLLEVIVDSLQADWVEPGIGRIDLGLEQVHPATVEPGPVRNRSRHERFVIIAIVAVAAVLNGWGSSSVGWGNAYYSAAVRSMGSSWHNFFYASFDAGGYVSVDKPPFALWVQVVSSKIFGYSRYSLLVPEVLAGAAAVWLLWWGLRRTWGATAAIIGAAVLAVMPINVVVNNSNNTDSMLVLLMTVAAVAAIEAVRIGRLRWLIAACLLAGSAMTTKMLAAAPVMPGLLIGYVWCAPLRWKVRIRQVAIATLVLVSAGLWWFVAVQSTAASARPYVGSTQTNSVFELAFERNGVDQVGGAGTGFPAGPVASAVSAAPATSVSPRPGGDVPAHLDGLSPAVLEIGLPAVKNNATGQRNTIGGLGFTSGEPGVARLIDLQLGGQIGWLVPFAVIGAIASVWATRLRPSPRLGALLVLGCWFGAGAIVFSFTKGVLHPYYMSGIGPPLAGLVGIGAATFRFDLVAGRLWALAGVAALGLTAWNEWAIWRRFDWRTWFIVVAAVFVAGCTVLAFVALVLVRRRRMDLGRRRSVALAATSAVAMMLAPAMWTQGSLQAGVSGAVPFAHPLAAGIVARTGNEITPNGGFQFPSISVPSLVAYLRGHRHGTRWAVAVQSAAPAEEIIIPSGEPVMAVGGFIGSDPIATSEQLRQKVRDGEVRYFFLSATAGGLIPSLLRSDVPVAWVIKECAVVPVSGWGRDVVEDTARPGTQAFPGGPLAAAFQLYDCKGRT
jgi:4-amino-4-deoxy-L-arabinose transferase-like glycosyltransferase